MRVFKYVLRLFLILIVLILVLAVGGLSFLTWKDYRPEAIEKVKTAGLARLNPDTIHEISFLTWNIGYSGLGKEMDFFYDGGSGVKASFEPYQRNLNGIYNLISTMDTLDIFLLQEVDRKSSRSYFTDQVEILSKHYPDFSQAFSQNYQVPFVPFPLFNPLSKIFSGLFSLCRFTPVSSERMASPANFPWPKKIFFPDRCLLVQKFELATGKQLVVINLHQSAWTEGETLRKQEMQQLKKLMLEEYSNGNYVVAGGDWNQNPPGFTPKAIITGDLALSKDLPISGTFVPEGWCWAYDPKFPTNRDLDQPYIKGQTKTTVFDYFLCSPNVTVTEIRTLPEGFAFSDHNPVYLRVRLRGDSIFYAGKVPPIPKKDQR